MKRFLDVILAFLGMVILSPVFLVVPVLIKLDSSGSVFFRQERIGRKFRPFTIYKFRTMRPEHNGSGLPVTVQGDKRVTRLGKFLRKYKIDELPQLYNVLKGDMSFVGPRPEIKKYVELYRKDYEKLLNVRPGITDPASLEYSREESMLPASDESEKTYVSKILPRKIRLSSSYVDNQNVFYDIKLIFKTALKSWGKFKMFVLH